MKRLATLFCRIVATTVVSANCMVATADENPVGTAAQPAITSAQGSTKAAADPLEFFRLTQKLQKLYRQVDELEAQGKQEEAERSKKEMQQVINKISSLKDNAPPPHDPPKHAHEESDLAGWYCIVIPTAIVLLLFLSVFFIRIRIRGGRNTMREYFKDNHIEAEVIDGWMPPVRFWIYNRKFDQWCQFRDEDGNVRWARIRHPLLGGRRIDFFD